MKTPSETGDRDSLTATVAALEDRTAALETRMRTLEAVLAGDRREEVVYAAAALRDARPAAANLRYTAGVLREAMTAGAREEQARQAPPHLRAVS